MYREMSRALSPPSARIGSGAKDEAYKRFIDGLRAIAVGSVILFHLFPTALPGGFVGVDVFFVISGYLITGQIRHQVAAGKFSLGSFYARRVRRIVPPLFAMLVPTCVAAFAILKPEDMQSFAKSLFAQTFSAQNLDFLAEGEYFRGADTKPLLHTWSLAIEEQFYLFWPMLLLSMRRMRRGPMLALVLALMVASFVLNDQLIAISPKSSFFLLPTRAWELAMGGLVALIDEDSVVGWRPTGRAAAAMADAGVALILFSVFWIDSRMPFPGNVALLPVVGTFLVLASGGSGWATRQALASRPMVSIGLISYPLYLWHWPILTFMRHLQFPVQAPAGLALFLVLTIGAAVLSNRLVEVPIRRRQLLSTDRRLFVAVGATFTMLTLFSVHVLSTKGALYRFPPKARPFLAASFDAQDDRCGFVFRTLHPRSEVCELVSGGASGRRILLWGNSHADMWSAALSDKARVQGATLFLNAKNCRGTTDSAFCDLAVQDKIVAYASANRITDVILSSTWHGSYGIADDVFEASLARQVDRIVKLGARVWLVIDVPVAIQFDPLAAYREHPADPVIGQIPSASHAPQHDRELRLFHALQAAHPKFVNIIDVRGVFCDAIRCVGGRDGQVWYHDDGHLTNAGARAGAGAFDAVFAP